MDEHNDVAVGQATSQDGDQTTTASGWPKYAEDARPADQEPPQGTESKQDEPESDGNGETSEASPAEPESAEQAEAASEAESAEDAEAVSGPEVVEEAASEQEAAEEAEAGPVEESADGPEGAAGDESAVDEGAAEEPEEAPDEAEAATAPESATAADLSAEQLIDPDDAERFQHEWRDVKAAFVDDPPDAVRQASVLVGEAVDGLTAALTRLRETLDGQSREVDDADTERLRLVLRGYGSLLDHILTR